MKKLGLLFICLFCFSGCGKHEGTTGVLGTGAGAAVGSSVSSKKNKGMGTLVGALIGNYWGRQVGKAADKEEEKEVRGQKNEIRHLRAENRNLKNAIEKWCYHCKEKINLVGANSCPYCGNDLAIEKYCRGCTRNFDPDSKYRYCPSCRGGVLLSYR